MSITQAPTQNTEGRSQALSLESCTSKLSPGEVHNTSPRILSIALMEPVHSSSGAGTRAVRTPSPPVTPDSGTRRLLSTFKLSSWRWYCLLLDLKLLFGNWQTHPECRSCYGVQEYNHPHIRHPNLVLSQGASLNYANTVCTQLLLARG